MGHDLPDLLINCDEGRPLGASLFSWQLTIMSVAFSVNILMKRRSRMIAWLPATTSSYKQRLRLKQC